MVRLRQVLRGQCGRPWPAPILPSLALFASSVTTAQAKAAGNTVQWQAFKSRLDGQLTTPITDSSNAYQGSELSWGTDYALGYQALLGSDPTTAAGYADKAIAILNSGLNDYQKGNWITHGFLARGDGTTTVFTLPHTPTGTVTVHFHPVSTATITKGSANGQDAVAYYSRFLKVSNTSDGTANYTEGVDWRHNPAYQNNLIDWSLGTANQPTTGATYYVTYADQSTNIAGPTHTLSGTTLTFTTAPPTTSAIYVEYCYSTAQNNYQQTGTADGGYTSILIDGPGYPSRYLVKHPATVYDWLYNYANLPSALKSQAESLFPQWYTACKNGTVYKGTSPLSNYGDGATVSRMFGAVVLNAHGVSGGSTELSEMTAATTGFRDATIVPNLANASNSAKGGWWPEGLNYGALAMQNLLLTALAYENATSNTATQERAWAGEIIKALIHSRYWKGSYTVSGKAYNGYCSALGDNYAYPEPFPGNDFLYILAALSSDATAAKYANYELQNTVNPQSANWLDLMFRDPAAATLAPETNEPLSYFAVGSNTLFSRAAWDYASTWVNATFMNLFDCDHQSYAPGTVIIHRGADDLLCYTPGVCLYQGSGHDKSTYSNTLIADDGGAGVQNYRFGMGAWYGPTVSTTGTSVTAQSSGSGYSYIQGEYHQAYSLNSVPGNGGSVSELTRSILHVLPDYVIVYDRVTLKSSSYTARTRWFTRNTPTVSGNGFTASQGSSKLFMAGYSSVALTTTVTPVTLGSPPVTVQQTDTVPTSAGTKFRFVTAFQTAPSATASMDASARLTSSDSQLEGVTLGNVVALFCSTLPLTTPVSYSLTSANGVTITHYICDLTAGHTYTLSGATAGSATADAGGVLKFTTTGTGSPQTVMMAA